MIVICCNENVRPSALLLDIQKILIQNKKYHAEKGKTASQQLKAFYLKWQTWIIYIEKVFNCNAIRTQKMFTPGHFDP